MPFTTKILYTANMLGLALFLGMAFLFPLHGQTQARQRLEELQTEGVTGAVSTDKHHGIDGTADWVVDPAITGGRAAANVGIGLTLLNVSMFFASTMTKKKKS